MNVCSDLLIGLDTSDKNLDGLIPDIIENGVKLTSPKKMALKRAIQKLQASHGFEHGNVSPNTNNNLIKGSIDTSSFSKGMYILSIKQGNKTFKKKVILK